MPLHLALGFLVCEMGILIKPPQELHNKLELISAARPALWPSGTADRKFDSIKYILKKGGQCCICYLHIISNQCDAEFCISNTNYIIQIVRRMLGKGQSGVFGTWEVVWDCGVSMLAGCFC